MNRYIIITTTVNTRAIANNLANSLLENKIAACIQVVPKIESFYSWEDKVQKQKELLLLIKTTDSKRESVVKTIKDIHPYTNPQITSIAFDVLTSAYKNWFDSSLATSNE